jgi:hypothetical protein
MTVPSVKAQAKTMTGVFAMACLISADLIYLPYSSLDLDLVGFAGNSADIVVSEQPPATPVPVRYVIKDASP